MGFNTVNAGTIAAIITLDSSRFTAGVNGALSSLSRFSDTSLSMGTRVTSLGRGVDTLGMSMTKFISIPIAGAMLASMGAAVKFESAITGVAKTANLTDTEVKRLGDGIMEMSTKIPKTTTELAGIAEVAGQLGIKKHSIQEFTEVMANMATATNMTAEEAATQLARFANITAMSQKDFDRLGSVIVDLGNNFATTEAEISEAGMRLAGAGKLVRMSEADIMAISAAYTSLGINVEAGGTAISRVLRDIEFNVQTGGESLSKFAEVSGKSVADFSAAWKSDAATAFDSVVIGLNKIYKEGGNVIQTLDEMGFTEIRVTDAMSRLATSGTVLTDSLHHARSAWEDNNALQKEAERRYATSESQLKLLGNQANVVAIQFGQVMLPALQDVVDGARDLLQWVEGLDEGTKRNIVTFAKFAVAIGPAVLILGKLTKTVGGVMSAVELAANGGRILASNYTLVEKSVAGLIVKYNAWKAASAAAAASQAAEAAAARVGYGMKVKDTVATAANAAATTASDAVRKVSLGTIASETAAKGVNTAATVASTAATTAATVAQKGFIAVAMTNPLTWVIAAVAGLVALAAWITTVNEGTENLTASSKRQKKEMEKLEGEYANAKKEFGETSVEAQNLAAKLDEASTAFETNKMTVEEWNDRIDESKKRSEDFRQKQTEMTNEFNVSAGSIRKLADEFDELSKKEGRTQTDKLRLLDVTTQLNGAVENCSITYSTLTDELDTTSQAVRNLANQEIDRQRGELAVSRMNDLYGEQKNITKDLDVAQQQLTAATQQKTEADKQAESIQNPRIKSMGITTQAQREATEAVKSAQVEVDRLTEEQRKNEEQLRKNLPVMESHVSKQAALEAVTKLMTQAGVNQAQAVAWVNKELGYNVTNNELAAYKQQQHAEAVQQATEEVLKMIETMPGLATAISNAGWTIDEFSVKLVDAGMDAQTFQSIVSSQMDEVGNAMEAFKMRDTVTVDQFKQNLTDRANAQQLWSDSYKTIMDKTGLDGSSAFMQYIGKLPIDQANTLAQMADSPELAAIAEQYDKSMQGAYDNSLQWLDQLAVEGKDKSKMIGEGIGAGVDEGYADAAKAIIENSRNSMTETISVMREAAGVNSPSTETIPIGQGLADGVRVGLEQNQGMVLEAIASIMNQAISNASSGVSQWSAVGSQMMQNLVSGFSSQQGALVSTTNGMCSNAVASSRMILVIGFSESASMATQQFSSVFSSGLNAWRSATIATFAAAYMAIMAMSAAQMTAAGMQAARGFSTGFMSTFPASVFAMVSAVKAAAASMSAVAYPSMYASGSFAGDGFRDGLESRRSSIVSTAASIARDAVGALRKAGGEGSPWKTTIRSGEFAGDGLVVGMGRRVKDVEAMSKRLAMASVPDAYAHQYDAAVSSPSINNASMLAGASRQETIDYERLGAEVATAIGRYGNDGSGAVAEKLDEFGSGIIEAISNMSVNMDGKPVGNIVTDTVDKNLGKREAKKRRGF